MDVGEVAVELEAEVLLRVVVGGGHGGAGVFDDLKRRGFGDGTLGDADFVWAGWNLAAIQGTEEKYAGNWGNGVSTEIPDYAVHSLL